MRRFLRYTSIALLGMVLFMTGTARAANVAERLQESYAAIGGMKAAFTQLLVHKESGAKEKRSGTLHFKKPLLVRWETKKPAPELLLVGKDCIWNVFPDEELAYKYALDMAQDSRSLVRVITGQARLDQDFDIEDEGRDGKLLKVRIYPKEPAQSLVEALLWIHADTLLITRIRVYDFYGNENEITFTGHDTQTAVKDSLFTYNPPKGFEVEDRTKSGDSPAKPLLQ